MSTSKSRKNQFLATGSSQVTASTTSRGKSNPAASVARSKFGGNPNVYASVRSRTNVVGSASRRQVLPGQGDKPVGKSPVQVLDEAGNDVTPMPLLHQDPTAVKKNQSNILGDSSAGTPTDLMSQASIYNTANVTASTFGGGPFTRSVFSASQGTATDSLMGADDISEPTTEMPSQWQGVIQHKREDVKEDLKDSDLEKIVDLTLTETETIWLLDMPGICVSTESEEAPEIKKKNERYQELVKSRVGNDRFAERGMNTFNEPPKFKTIQTNRIVHNDIGIMATTWDMHDTYELLEKEAKAKEEKEDEEGTISRPSSPQATGETGSEGGSAQVKDVPTIREGSARSVRIESRATMASSVAGSESIFASRETGVSSIPSELSAIEEDKILRSDSFKKDLFIMERVINLNTYQPKQALYRGFDIIPDIDREGSSVSSQQISVADMGPTFDRLWAYTCALTKGRNVSSMSWNKLNPDLIAVGYGQFDFAHQRSGIVCCWSLKNPEYPERVYTVKEGVTSLDFSRANPNLLAVGLYDGGVAIYNVKNTTDEAIVDNFQSPGKHTAPVWHIKWIEKERGSGEDRAEVLVSISTDGRVTQWSIRKGFESYDLMKLKRIPTRMGGKKEKKGEAFISRHAGGMCFDFNTRDSNFADWSIRLWHQDRPRPVLNFFSSTKSVYDVTWSPRSATVFACVNEGAVEVWDLSSSTLDPLINYAPTSGAKQTSVTFAKNSECILVGDSEGQVTVYQLRCLPPPTQLFCILKSNQPIKSPLLRLQNDDTQEKKDEEEEKDDIPETD
ncbi:hypothetical protein KUTeg_016230 [Tegillarca granosa]|uniref:Dynein axonemal intermediate chain 4 n=1 Tax=Tegillarca granosa TaxID=220873 RepID=A0ABQ9EQK1_TEGGR|nr:hypothetical protein KUTeg_016230 [Tegillarca granosa]